MNYSELVDDGRIKRGRFSCKQVEDCLRIARRDLATAAAVIETSPEWSFNIAYNAMHQAGRAFMFRAGYRTVGQGHHATVVRFLEIGLGPRHEDALALMDRMRRKPRGRVGTHGPNAPQAEPRHLRPGGNHLPQRGRGGHRCSTEIRRRNRPSGPTVETLRRSCLSDRP